MSTRSSLLCRKFADDAMLVITKLHYVHVTASDCQ